MASFPAVVYSAQITASFGGSLLKSWQPTQAWNGIFSACLPKGKHKTCSLLPACWGCNKRGPAAAAPVLPPLNWSALQDGRTRCFLSSESLCRTSSAEPGSGPARNAKETHSVDGGGEGRKRSTTRDTNVYLFIAVISLSVVLLVWKPKL